MLHSLSGQLSVFLWDPAVLLDSIVLMCMFLLLFEQINDWLIDWRCPYVTYVRNAGRGQLSSEWHHNENENSYNYYAK